MQTRREDYGVDLGEPRPFTFERSERLRSIQGTALVSVEREKRNLENMQVKKRAAVFAAERRAEDQKIAKNAILFCSIYSNFNS